MALCSHKGVAQCLGYIGGDQAGLADFFGGDVTGQAVDVNAQNRSLEIAQALS